MSQDQANNAPAPVIYVGLDLGTTYSALAYRIVGEFYDSGVTLAGTELQFSNLGPARLDSKIPSILWVDDEKNVVSWGATDPLGVGYHKLEWFKLMVLFTDDLGEIKASKRFIETENSLKKLGLSVLEAISLYLARLWSRFKTQAERELWANFPGSSVDRCPIQLTLTKPANWPTDAVSRLKDAVAKAGISHDLKTLDEPESAGVKHLMDESRKMEVGDNFIICDCGGGTVDCIGYQVSKSSPLELSECVPGESILAGAVILDDAFKAMFLTKLEAMCPAPTFKAIPPREIDDLIMRYWDFQIKLQYDGSDKDWSITLPLTFIGAKGKRARRMADPLKIGSKMIITGHDLASVFDSVVGRIVSLIESQIHSVEAATGGKPKGVVVTGGFGRNNYVRSLVKAKVEEGSNGAIRVVSYGDMTGWTAVAVGGAEFARLMSQPQNPQSVAVVENRLSRRKYGFRWADQGLRWFIEPGTSLPARKPAKYAIDPRAFGVMNAHGCMYLTLEICAWAGVNSVQRICRLRLLAEAGSPGNNRFELGLTYDGTDPSFILFLNGRLQGSGQVTFDFD